jgi:hypothetical protein
MTNWRTQLHEAIEPDGADRLSAGAARAMRRVVVAAARAHAGEHAPVSWKRPLAFAVTVVLMIAAGITAGRHLDLSLPEDRRFTHAAAVTTGSEPVRASRQLQFSTPGGTRIIWVFNSDLDLKATMP